MDMSASDDHMRHRFAAAELGRVTAPLLDAVWPIYRPGRRSPFQHVGSAVLLRISDHYFAVSAAHVLDGARNGKLYMGIGTEVAELGGRFFTTSSAGPDKFDLAVWFLDAALVGASGNPGYVTADHIATVPDVVEPDTHVIIGFPHTKQPKKATGRELPAVAITHAGHALTAERIRELGYDPAFHLLIEFDKTKSYGSRGRATSPDPYGMSGGGIWAIPEIFAEPTPETLFTAIAIEWLKEDKAILATRVQPCLALIAREVPGVAPMLMPLLQ
jgi:hypothetical protein